ncbi:MAG: hypothetical protein GY850_14975 [bacterium]|nr:hypothetical protein [bacterium]
MCGEDEYCLFEPCAIETGICVPRPEICPDIWDPVCGCDNRTYPNACGAAVAGMSVKHKGACEPNGCCVDSCGDGVCAEIVCLECGCPCAETPENCPQDCLPNERVCCESFGYGASMEVCCESYEWTTPEECVVPDDFVGGGKKIVSDAFCLGTPF